MSSTDPILRITSSTTIHAPLDKVWTALTDTTTWMRWNRFVPDVTIREQPTTPTSDSTHDSANTNANTTSSILQKGTRLTFHVNMHPAASPSAPESLAKVDNHVGLVVSECVPPYAVGSSPEIGGGGENGEGDSTDPADSATPTQAPPATRKATITWANDTAFQGRVMATLHSAERVHELIEREVPDPEHGGTRTVTEVTNWEVQSGYLAYVVKWMFEGRLEENFGVWVDDLRGFVEGEMIQ
ncbi:uncharacterized protein BO97DRAFT_405600 [Aspergillus homomorphus CBS 101889]|uniref:Uncharacterized protein n=1 Tax=Aspergillus homomorphus (strain CBS 101889) TaxID=1450537 RepID=A0A395HXY7_ASPHC|nr:hypothetical protein BO97DRAFT_405600 [Aspergillus homomorphus CBS 101889]RAL12253.1 hypothetical protein BO97DRAFT_405600 [Aspergillus homomorphus CBS 101889]